MKVLVLVCVVVRKRRNVLNRCCVDHFLFSFKRYACLYVSLDIYCSIFAVHNILYSIHYTVCFLAYNTSYNVPAYSVHYMMYIDTNTDCTTYSVPVIT